MKINTLPTTKEKRYNDKMEKLGFTRKKYWVHAEDHNRIKKLADNLRHKRFIKLGIIDDD